MKKILIVEDEQSVRETFSAAVEEMDYTAICASGGELALSILNDNPDIALAIIDMVMPELSGKDLIRKIRTHSSMAKLPVIMVSGKMTASEVQELLDLGASYFLPKPVKIDKLGEYVSKLIGR